MTILWLRTETKKNEKRTPITPDNVCKLINDGVKVYVEASNKRIFKDIEYKKVGAQIVPEHSWVNAPKEAYILGLKELIGFEDLALSHKHIMFAHVYKNQNNWQKILTQFKKGGGILYDLEFLIKEDNTRAAAFGFYAGFVGAHLALTAFIAKTCGKLFQAEYFYKDESKLIYNIKSNLKQLTKIPIAVITGSNGKCGRGAIEYFKSLNLETIGLNRQHIQNKNYKATILSSDILINCIYVNNKTPILLSINDLNSSDHKLSVICDVSCDPNNPNNPLPFYNEITTFDSPIKKIKTNYNEIYLIAIDHLPSFLPKMSSIQFSNDLFPHLQKLLSNNITYPWLHAEQFFYSKLNEIPD